MSASFQCTIVTPQERLLDERVTYAMVPAHDGLMGVAPSRAPMVIKLGEGILRLDFTEGGSRWFYVRGGFGQMLGDKLTLLSAEAVPAERIVSTDAQAALREAQARATPTLEAVDRRGREIARASNMLKAVDRMGNKV